MPVKGRLSTLISVQQEAPHQVIEEGALANVCIADDNHVVYSILKSFFELQGKLMRAWHPHCAVYDLHTLQHFLYACLPWVEILHILREKA